MADYIYTAHDSPVSPPTWELALEVASSYPTDSGTAIPSGNVLNVFGGTSGRDINTTGAGNTIHVELNNAITLGDLSNITGSDALTCTTGNVLIQSGNLIIPDGNSTGTVGYMYQATQTLIISALQNLYLGNTAGALPNAGTHTRNVGVGYIAMNSITNGVDNTGVGVNVMDGLTTGNQNTSIGGQSGGTFTTGSNNCFLGFQAGNAHTGADSNNICLGSLVSGVAGESNTTRIGGIRGVTTNVNDAIAVLIDSTGQLGTISSSIRYKENVMDMDDYSSGLLELRPVTFNYKEHPGFTETGLIAEEVAEVMPELVVYKDGEPETVKYHLLVNYLINELQKLEKRVTELESK